MGQTLGAASIKLSDPKRTPVDPMTASTGFIELLKDLLVPVGALTIKRMFGGAGIYIDGSFIAIVDKDVIYFKTDESTRKAFEAEGTGPFTYDTKHGPGTLNSYWRAPERLLDEPDEMAEWARAALGVARRAEADKAKRSLKGSAKAKAVSARKPARH